MFAEEQNHITEKVGSKMCCRILSVDKEIWWNGPNQFTKSVCFGSSRNLQYIIFFILKYILITTVNSSLRHAFWGE